MKQPPQATHATLATFRVDPSREAEQRRVLEEVIVPGVRKAPGFVSGYWTLDREVGESAVLLAFESAVDARNMAGNVRANAANQAAAGLELVSIRIVEILVSA